MSDKKFYLSELKSEECQCGKAKKSGKSFCYHCFKNLPDDFQKDLYLPIGGGYEEAYENSVKFLEN